MTRRLVLAASSLLLAASAAGAQAHMWSLNAGAGIPSQGAWGSNTQTGVSTGVGMLFKLTHGWSLGPVVNNSMFKADRSKLSGAQDYRVNWSSLGVGVRRTFGPEDYLVRPYVGVNAGLAFVEQRVSLSGPAETSYRAGANAGPEGGLLLNIDPAQLDIHMSYNALRTSTMRFADAFATNTLHAYRIQFGLTFPGLW